MGWVLPRWEGLDGWALNRKDKKWKIRDNLEVTPIDVKMRNKKLKMV